MNSSPLQSNAYYIWFIGRIEEEEKRIDVNFYPKKTLGKCYLSPAAALAILHPGKLGEGMERGKWANSPYREMQTQAPPALSHKQQPPAPPLFWKG